MYKVETVIQGVAPFLFNRPEDERKTVGNISEEERRESAAVTKLHKNGHGLMATAWMVKQTLLNGAKQCLKGKASISNYVKAAVFPTDGLFDREEADFLHETWGRVPPKTGALVKVWRPAMKEGWEMRLTFHVTDDRLTADALRLAWENSGMMVGIGSWRPEFGRFIVKEWKVIKEAKKKSA